MIGKIIIFIALFSLAISAQTFMGYTWALPLALVILIAYLFIKIVGKILKRDRGGSDGDGDNRYFDIWTD
jgi:cobalamin synthase